MKICCKRVKTSCDYTFYNRTTNMSKLNATKRETLIFVCYALHLSLNFLFKSKVKLNYFYYTVVELFTIRSNTKHEHTLPTKSPNLFIILVCTNMHFIVDWWASSAHICYKKVSGTSLWSHSIESLKYFEYMTICGYKRFIRFICVLELRYGKWIDF